MYCLSVHRFNLILTLHTNRQDYQSSLNYIVIIVVVEEFKDKRRRLLEEKGRVDTQLEVEICRKEQEAQRPGQERLLQEGVNQQNNTEQNLRQRAVINNGSERTVNDQPHREIDTELKYIAQEENEQTSVMKSTRTVPPATERPRHGYVRLHEPAPAGPNERLIQPVGTHQVTLAERIDSVVEELESQPSLIPSASADGNGGNGNGSQERRQGL